MLRPVRLFAMGASLAGAITPALAVEPAMTQRPWLTFGASPGLGLGPHAGHVDVGARLGVDVDFWPARWLTLGLHAGALGVISLLKDDGYAGALAAKLGVRVPLRRFDVTLEFMTGPGYRKSNEYCPLGLSPWTGDSACEDSTRSGRVLFLGAAAGLLINGQRGVQLGPTLRYDRYDRVNAFTLGFAIVLPLIVL